MKYPLANSAKTSGLYKSSDTQTDDSFQLHRLSLDKAKSANNPKSVLWRQPHPVKVNIIQNQSFQDYHILPKCKLSNQSLQHHILLKLKLSKMIPFKMPDLPKVKIIEQLLFHDYHTISKWKMSQSSPFKTTTYHTKWELLKMHPFKTITPLKVQIGQNQSLQNGYCQKSVLLTPTYPSKWKLSQISPFKTNTFFQSKNHWKWFLSRPLHRFKVQIIQNNSLEDHHILPSESYPKSVL